ncbi:hypothetical protein E8E11_000200 [Didymella keratinophila]|nr:hypothetical protein E8E11_000200 [Didymella keratinophila]
MYTGFLLSVTFSIWLIVSAHQYSKPPGKYCLIMADYFTRGLNPDHWSYEAQTGGFEHGEFSWATADRQNVFVDDEGLHIVPTLTTESTTIDEVQLLDGYTVNLTSVSSDWGSCTSPDVKMCSVTSNATLGRIIPPIRSARITTKGKKSIKYGRVEIVAKMPKGDWLWPAIWMMPEEPVYGQWPRSGQIDIAELRGNSRHYPRGRDLVTSTLHYGPDPQHDGYLQTYDTFYFQKRRTDFFDKFFTYGFEWNEEYMHMWVDHKSIFTILFEHKTTFWPRGMFQGMASLNGTMANNPWRGAESVMAPFNQAFHLNLKVAAEAQHGYFYDNTFNKPWVDHTPLAAREFWNAREKWLPTWGNCTDRGMTIKSVKMWQQCK